MKASAEGQRLRSPYQAAAELHALLGSGRVRPPFILVAHSFDGALARVFASLYSTDVAGLVLVDPFQPEFMDWLREHQPTNYEAFVKVGESRYVPNWDRAMAEFREASTLPDVPITVLTSVNRARQEHDALEQGISVEEWRAGAAAIVEAQRQGLSNVPRGILEEVDGASHNLPREQPATVARAIEEVWLKARK